MKLLTYFITYTHRKNAIFEIEFSDFRNIHPSNCLYTSDVITYMENYYINEIVL